MILKDHHRALLRSIPLNGGIPLATQRKKGFCDLERNGLVFEVRGCRDLWRPRPKKLTTAGRACKRLLDEIPVDA